MLRPKPSPSESMPAIQASHVSKDFFLLEEASIWSLLNGGKSLPRHRAVNDVTLEVAPGEFVGVLGHNGAGKSTLLRTLGSVYAPTEGHLTTNGDVSGVFELGVSGNEFMTGETYAQRAFEQFSGPQDDRVTFLDEVREFSELEEAFERPIRTYSAGMKARLFFAVATSFRKDIYLIDEVLAVGDAYFRQRCWRRLREFKSRGVSGILVAHDWTSILKLCERCYILERGAVVAGGDSFPVVREYLGFESPKGPLPIAFAESMNTEFTARPHEDLELSLPIVSQAPSSVLFGLSIELKRTDVGWENVMLLEAKPLELAAGENTIEISIPRMPLVPGDYLLHIYLLQREAGSGATTTLDARTWYHGNSLTLTVEGTPAKGIAHMQPVLQRVRGSP